MKSLIIICSLIASTALATESMKVFFIEPKNGATVPREFTVKFGVQGMMVKPAGSMQKDTGHHHLIIDGKPVPAGQVVSKDEHHLHMGQGQMETKILLPAGKHTLTLQFADGAHVSYGEKMSSTISVHVK